MREIRLTFSADEFGAVSKILVDMGIGFTVEPVKEPEAEVEAAAPRTALPQPSAPRRTKKKARPGGKGAPKRESVPVSGADRLREALTRKTVEESSRGELPNRLPEGLAGGAAPPGDQPQ